LLVLVICLPTHASAAVLIYGTNESYAKKTSLAEAATAPDSAGKTVIVTASQTLTGNLTWPSDRKLKIEKGGLINTTGYTLTINGPFEAGNYQVFSGNGKVTGLSEVSPDWFGAGITNDDTASINTAISSCSTGGRVLFNPTRTYNIGTLDTIARPITIDFNNAYLKSVTSGVMFSIKQSSPDSYADRIVLKNGNLIAGARNPSDVIKIYYGAINPTIENFNIQGVTATHSYIWNHSGYGLRLIDCKFRQGKVPYAVYLRHSDSDFYVFSLAIDIDHVDISNISGIGIYMEGGIVSIRGQSVIEGCAGGGIKHGSVAYGQNISISDTYFEHNYTHDIDIAASTGGNYTIKNCFFGDGSRPTSSYDHINVVPATKLTLIGNTFTDGGVNGGALTSYVSINNIVRISHAPGYSSSGVDMELADAIRGSIKREIINPQNKTKLISVPPNSSANVVVDQPLTGTAYDKWEIAGSYNLGAAGIGELFRVYVSRQDAAITGIVLTDLHKYKTVSTVTVVDGGGKYSINIENPRPSAMHFLVTFDGNNRMY